MPNTDFISAEELFERVGRLFEAYETDNTDRHINIGLHELLVLTCEAGLSNTAYAYGDLRSQVEHLCQKHHIDAADTRAIHQTRRHSNTSSPILPEDFGYDIRALCIFIAAVFQTSIPHFLAVRMPHNHQHVGEGLPVNCRCLRCWVKTWDEKQIRVVPDISTDFAELRVDYCDESQFYDQSYLASLLTPHMTLNLIDCSIKGDRVTPRMIVVEPDHLVDISMLANSFEDYGHHPMNYILSKMGQRPNNFFTLLGNFSGTALDDIITHGKDQKLADTLKRNFAEKALEYVAYTDFDGEAFKSEASLQMNNLRQIVEGLFAEFDHEKAMLEPSFVCEQLGLQGRVDLMTTDFKLLVEQKSGRNWALEQGMGRQAGAHIEKHYVQALLYAAVLQRNFELAPQATRIFLLYSRYALPNGLLAVSQLGTLLSEAIKLRNEIVAIEQDMAENGFTPYLPQINAGTLNTKKLDTRFFNTYLLPRLQRQEQAFASLSDLETAYLDRMVRFICREQVLSKCGVRQGGGSAVSDLWNMSFDQKVETGNIYASLKIKEKRASSQWSGFDTIVLEVPDQGADFSPNFRLGDFVYLYAYEDDEPDCRKSILFKGVMEEIMPAEITVHLSNGQHNEAVISGEKFAIEHAASDMSGTGMRALDMLLHATPRRKAILLGQERPERDPLASLRHEHSVFYDAVVLKAMQAKDYYLIVGPPGTGKTSMAMRFIVEEELLLISHTASTQDGQLSQGILLMAYTNRAVDEICHMLTQAAIDYIRIGNEFACEPAYRHRLLSNLAATTPTLKALRDLLADSKVVVATTATMMARPYIFNIKHFTLAIVDEASQILEPNIIGLLAATHDDGSDAIGRFVLIGDHKQLPAVVRQSETEARVEDKLLTDIHLTNCGNSLFQRLIETEKSAKIADFIGTLFHQGRMHPEISAWPSASFYSAQPLQPVPLAHQVGTDIGYKGMGSDALDRQLVDHRLLFFNVEGDGNRQTNDKVNLGEARVVAALLRHIYQLRRGDFDIQQTVGIVVPYRNQIACIRHELEKLSIPELMGVAIDTVERYQGSGRDIIIYSTTVSHRYQMQFLTATTFVEDGHTIDRKLCVAITRARCQMIIVGNRSVLSSSKLYKDLLEGYHEADCML